MLKLLIFAVFSLDRTHANFRRSEMDEFYTSGNWVIGSQGNGYGKIRIISKYCKKRCVYLNRLKEVKTKAVLSVRKQLT